MICRKCKASVPDGQFCIQCGAAQEIQRKRRHRGNGQGTVYQLPNGTWRAEINIYANGLRIRRTKAGFTRKKDALDHLLILRENVNRNEPENPFAKATVFDIHQEWLKSQTYAQLSESKKTHYRTAWSRMKPTWHLNFASLRLSQMQSCLDALDEQLSGKGNDSGFYYPKRDIKAVFGHLYRFAIRNELVEKNRAELLELPECKASARDSFSREEVAALWADYRAGHNFTRYPLIMIYTGMRIGEMATQDLSKIYLDKHYMVGGIKTEAGKNRTIPLAAIIEPLVVEAIPRARYGLLPMGRDDFYDEYAVLVERTKIRDLPPHCCRHTTATALAEAGIAPAIIQEILGHAKYDTTLGYTHISAKEKVAAINKMSPI